MKKLFSLEVILLALFTLMSCEKEEAGNNNVENNGMRLLKSEIYTGDGQLVVTEEWTYDNNFECVTTYYDGVPNYKLETRKGDGILTEQYFELELDNWVMGRERVEKRDSEGRLKSIEISVGNPVLHHTLETYTYNGDSAFCVYYDNEQLKSKTVIVRDEYTTESIHYTYAGNNQWEEMTYSYQKYVITYTDKKNDKPLCVVYYNKEGYEKSRDDYEWNGESYKLYKTLIGKKTLYQEKLVEGNTTTFISYPTTLYGEEYNDPIQKLVTTVNGNVTEKWTYKYENGWVLTKREVDYYEDVKK